MSVERGQDQSLNCRRVVANLTQPLDIVTRAGSDGSIANVSESGAQSSGESRQAAAANANLGETSAGTGKPNAKAP